MICGDGEQIIPDEGRNIPYGYPIDTLWIRYRGFSAVKNGPHPGENRPNFDICPVFAVKKGNICTKQRPRNDGHTRNRVHEPQNGVKTGVEARSIYALYI